MKPSVAACTAKLVAMETDTANEISRLRRRVHDIVASLASDDDDVDSDGGGSHGIRLRKMANELLHAPTMRAREGRLSREEIEVVVNDIERQLVNRTFGGAPRRR